MNILYISKLTGDMWAGPNNSVPAQIAAQSKIDNVFWYNFNRLISDSWSKLDYFNNLNDFPQRKIKFLPKPFNNPDLVVFEGTYEYPFCSLIFDIWKKNIPYIVVPRSSLTELAQHNKYIKKIIGNILFFNRFLNKALAIHYLTEKEYLNSGYKWNKNYMIIPNGIENKTFIKTKKITQQLKGIYIGRIEIYQKGLDLLVEACFHIQRELREANCRINLYGPDRNNSTERLQKNIDRAGIQDFIFIHDAIFNEEKKNVQTEADFFIMTSRFEGHSMGLIEALSYGLPSIVTDGTNMSAEITEADAGWASATTIDGIANMLLKMIHQADYFHEKSKNAIRLAKRYNWDTLAEKSHYEYVKLLNRFFSKEHKTGE